MKRHLKYLAGCGLLLALLSGCGNERPEPAPREAGGNAVVQLSFTLPDATRAYDALETSVLRIYKVEDDGSGGEAEGLIRRYEPATDIPADLYLAAGKYRVKIDAGDKSKASFTNKTYHGEADFTLTDHEVKNVEVVCRLTNIAVKVVFDPTIEKFDEGYELYVSASDAFSKTAAETGSVPTLKYTADGTGYFILPAGVSDISWGFYGSSSDPIVATYPTEYTGVLSAPQGGMLYTLTYRFSDFADGYLSVSVESRKYESKHDDHFSFSPQPRLTGIGFSLTNVVAERTAPLNFQLSSLTPFSSLTLEANGTRYDIITGGTVNGDLAAQGIACTMDNSGESGLLTIGEEFIAQLPPGISTLSFAAQDADGTDGKAVVRVAVTGAAGLESADLWMRTGTLSAVSTDPAATEVKIRYKEEDADEWTVLDAVHDGDYRYVAEDAEIRAGRKYRIQLLENGAASGAVKLVTTEEGVQVPGAGFEEWHTQSNGAWYPYAQGGQQYWDTGNPGSITMSVNITTKGAARTGSSGSVSAAMETKFVGVLGIGKLAGGNIYLGQFMGREEMGGKVNFGREFEFNARPEALRVWVKCNPKGTDQARIFLCLINMTNGKRYHMVNTNDIVKTKFDAHAEFCYSDNNNKGPATLEGHILGYADLMLGTAITGWTMIDIPIIYRDQYMHEKPNMLMITATSSWQSDEFIGEVGSTMDLDDVEFIY